MEIRNYRKQCIFALFFYFLALIPVWLENGFTRDNSATFYLLYLTYSILGALFYPYCLALVNSWKKGVSESLYWFNGGIFILCILFAIPMGMYYVIRNKWG
ncbi:hypothetical protein [Pantoea sp.]|uniref:hypothetical protein n=1 Tax=Pantoea sp. TaxID=69393 RepID=UPI0028A1B826|nr:hypothetical protein [Pantoea sp.]